MIKYSKGDIFAADVDAIVNTVNTVGVMGKGLALQFKGRYPRNYELYRAACERGEVQLGRMFVTEPHEIDGPQFIINFPTKGHWKANSRLSDIRAGLQDLVRVIREHGIRSIAIPPLGAGNGGLEWLDVRPVIAAALESLTDVEVEVFEPNVKHREIVGEPARPLARASALMVSLILTYARQRHGVEPWESAQGASHLEIQKLMYFASLRLPPLKLEFAQAKYGPYSDTVRIMLQKLEGTYLRGFGDGSDSVMALTPIEVTEAGLAALESYSPPAEDAELIGNTVNEVMTFINGFEGPYPLELLSSVKFASEKLKSDDKDTVVAFVKGWTERKGRLFTEDHIETALARVQG